MRTTLVDAVRQVFEVNGQPVPGDLAKAGMSLADDFAQLPPEERLSIVAREWPKAQALAKRLAKTHGMRTDEAGSQLATGVAQALEFAATPQHWLNAGRVKRTLARVNFHLDPDFRALTVEKRSPDLKQTLERLFPRNLARHFEDKLDGRAGEWFASLDLFSREHAAKAVGSEAQALSYREQRKAELADRVRRDFAEYSEYVRDLIAQIDGTTMAMFEPLAPDDAKALKELLDADRALVERYVETLFGLMDLDPPAAS